MKDGRTQQSLADDLNLPRQTIGFWIRRFRSENTVERKHGSGRKRKTSETTDRAILREVKKSRFVTAHEIQEEFSLQHISTKTIKRRITESGMFKSYWAARKPFLRPANIEKRLQWCIEHQHWSVEQWRSVLWSDESPFVLRFSRKRRVWRGHNERYDSKCTIGTLKHDKKIMVWGCFAAKGVGKLYRVQGIMNKEQYHKILQYCLFPSAELLFGNEDWVLQQDNDPKHTAIINKNYVATKVANGICRTFEWPSQTPDLNPIENLWSILDWECSHRTVNNEEELFNELQEAWKALPTTQLEPLVNSMPRRCAAVIAAGGKMTKY